MIDAHLNFRWDTPKHLHLGVSGSIAAYKMPDMVRLWCDAGLKVSVTLTEAAQRFITPLSFSSLGADPVYTSIFDDAPFAHLEAGRQADAFVIAPATAAIISRIATGAADEILACQVLAFTGMSEGRFVLAPAMNPRMWSNLATQANVHLLQQRGCVLVEPGMGRTACGEEGQGRLADQKEIFLAGMKAIAPKDLLGKHIMLTMGPTRETWDSLRYWTNPSSGVMGASIAVAAWLRGAEVEAICGPGCPWLPKDIIRHNVGTAQEMYESAARVWSEADIGIFTAAVADFTPESSGKAGKFKKSMAPDGFMLHFLPTVDILKTLAHQRRPEQKVIGFAAESSGLEDSVKGKLTSKKADIVVGNLLNDGFGTAEDRVFVADKQGREEHWSSLSKPEIAWRLLSWLQSL